jgi:hypothetical protein
VKFDVTGFETKTELKERLKLHESLLRKNDQNTKKIIAMS